MRELRSRPAILLATVLLTAVLGGCASRLAGNLAGAILEQNDPETVRDGAPAYLLMVDGLIQGDPDNATLLRGGASLYGVYAALFVEDAERARRLADRARQYGERALCAGRSSVCGLSKRPHEEFVEGLQRLSRRNVAHPGDLPRHTSLPRSASPVRRGHHLLAGALALSAELTQARIIDGWGG